MKQLMSQIGLQRRWNKREQLTKKEHSLNQKAERIQVEATRNGGRLGAACAAARCIERFSAPCTGHEETR